MNKVLTITEPYATLIMIGKKQYETRSWKTNYRGRLLIHSSKKVPKLAEYIDDDLFRRALEWHFGSVDKAMYQMRQTAGHILGCVDLVDVLPVTSLIENITDDEYALGDYSFGRYGWQCKIPMRFCDPIPVSGHLGLWDYDEV